MLLHFKNPSRFSSAVSGLICLEELTFSETVSCEFVPLKLRIRFVVADL